MAVYTDIRDDQLEAWLDLYDLGGLHAFKGIAEGVENSNFLLTTDNGSFILTLYEKRVDPADLPFFLGLMEHLSARGINCPRPVRMRSGAFLGELAGRPAAIVTYLAGEGFTVERRNALSLDGWRPLFERSGERADEIEPGLAAFIRTELDRLESDWPAGLPAGVIHADLFRDNVFFLKDELSGIFDFYFACDDLFAYDVAICMNAWCFEPDWSFNVTKARALLEGYTARRPLGADEFDALPVLCRGSAMRFLLTRLYDWLNVPPGALVTPHDPREYLAKLRFHQGIADAGAYGLDMAGRIVSGGVA